MMEVLEIILVWLFFLTAGYALGIGTVMVMIYSNSMDRFIIFISGRLYYVDGEKVLKVTEATKNPLPAD